MSEIKTSFTDWESGLQHYGVLGMKWGQRRYQNKDGSLTAAGEKHYAKTGEYGYTYKSHATKKYERKADKMDMKAHQTIRKAESMERGAKRDKLIAKADAQYKKGQMFSNRARRSSEIDAGEQEYAKSLSTGKALALTLLAGGATTKGYAQYRAMSGQSGKALTGKKIVSGILAYNFGSVGSRQRKAAYIRQDEGRKGLGQKAYNLNKKITNVAGGMIDAGIDKAKRYSR